MWIGGRRTAPAALAVLAVGLVTLTACGDPLAVEDGLEIRSTGSALIVTNDRDANVHYFVVERIDGAVIDWLQCTVPDDPERCPFVPPGETREIPYPEIAGYDDGDEEAIFYWWELEPAPEPDEPDAHRVGASGSLALEL